MRSIDPVLLHRFLYMIKNDRLFAFYTTYTDLIILMYVYD